MKLKKTFCLLLALTLLLCGCGSSAKSAAMVESPYYYDGGESYEAAAEEALFDYEPSPDYRESNSATGSVPTQQLPQARKWVITMNVQAETETLDEALEAINARIAELGGYVENQNFNNGSISSSRRNRNVSMTVRVPAASADAFLQTLSGTTNVVSSSKNVEDITLTYTDTESRISALKAEEARLLELMAKAEDMSDLLVIEERLTEIRYQLDNYGSRLRRYDNQVDYATIDLYISEVTKYTPVAKLTFWQRTVSGFLGSLEDLGDTLVGMIEWIIVNIPYLAFFTLIGWIIFILAKKSHKRSEAKKAALYQKRMQEYQAQMAKQEANKTE